jgi:hypothetical protein
LETIAGRHLVRPPAPGGRRVTALEAINRLIACPQTRQAFRMPGGAI